MIRNHNTSSAQNTKLQQKYKREGDKTKERELKGREGERERGGGEREGRIWD